ncbi:MAG: hypothetical protein Q4G35_13695 [Propionibacteriaceae bacterium]|nr:hypothetical protein [Propionibacteriaceae bacterium]
MSNQQWNQGQGGEWAPQQPEGAQQQEPQSQQDWSQPRPDWNQPVPQASASGNEWTREQPAVQPSASGNDWTQQAQPQRSAGEWQQAQPQPSAGDWHHAQPQSGNDWNQQPQTQQQWPQPGWDQGGQQWGQQQAEQQWGQTHQQWGQQPQPPQQQWGQHDYLPAGAGYAGTGTPQWAPPPPRKPSPFDLKFDQPALPQAAGTVFLTGSIGLGVWWLFQVINALSYVADYPLDFLSNVLGNAGLALFGIMLLRGVLEGAVAIWKKPAPEAEKPKDEPEAEDTTTP